MLVIESKINLNNSNEQKRKIAVNTIFGLIFMCLFVPMSIIFLFCLVSSFNQVLSQVNAPLVTISDGQLRGVARRTVYQNITYYAYRGIPYAEKPVGKLRFTNSAKNGPWKGVLDATEDKSGCVQLLSQEPTIKPEVIGTEDCLYINVYTTNVTGNLPVMVYIHGGGFTFDSSKYERYAPDRFLEYDVIFVSFNYRLGIFGFLSTEDTTTPGNWGLKDQVLALKWIKNNIKFFGGNPNKITLFGESAGSQAISYLVQSDLTKGLINGAIMESGVTLCYSALIRNARKSAFNVGKRLGYVTLNSSALVEYLRSVDSERLKLVERYVSLSEDKTFGVVEEPQHPGAVVSGKSWEKLSKGEFHHIPIIIGFTSNEGAYFFNNTNNALPLLNQTGSDVSKLAPLDLTRNKTKRLIAGIRIKRHFASLGFDLNTVKGISRFLSNDRFDRPIREAARLSSIYTDVYYYKFTYEGELGNENNNFEGVGHSEDLNYFFPLGHLNRTVNKRDAKFIQKYITLWTNFAKTGNPTPTGSRNNSLLDNVVWEPNNPKSNATAVIKYLEINETFSMKINPFQELWTFYQEIFQDLGDPPYSLY